MNIMGLGLAEDAGEARPQHPTHETEAMKEHHDSSYPHAVQCV
jgi:hypothetical protein